MNLLPEQYKKNLRLEAWRRFLIFFGTYFSIVGIVGIMLILPSYFFLQFQIGTLETTLKSERNGINYQKTLQGQQQVLTINQTFQAFVSFETSGIKVVLPLEDLLSRTLTGITLSSYNYTEQVGGELRIQLAGRADRRETLLAFVDNLNKSPYMSAPISASTSDLIRDKDLTFAFDFPIRNIVK
jgi:hypothetical protein